MYLIYFGREAVRKEQLKQELLSTLSEKLGSLGEDPAMQFIEVRGKKGNVTLHTGMPKDSVQLLVGKPDQAELSNIGNTAYEDWGYKIKNRYVPDLNINFENGKLESVRQR